MQALRVRVPRDRLKRRAMRQHPAARLRSNREQESAPIALDLEQVAASRPRTPLAVWRRSEAELQSRKAADRLGRHGSTRRKESLTRCLDRFGNRAPETNVPVWP